MWVCVSEPFNLIEVTKAIIEQAKGSVPSVHAWDALHKCLCNSLKGKRFLLVLDDVWTEDNNDWTPLKLSFKGGSPGSRVLVTTRNERVAQIMGSTHTHNLGKLSDNDSWSMFESIAFSGRQEDLTKCSSCRQDNWKSNKKAKNEWNSILENEIWEIQKIAYDVLPSLFLSYNHLPSILKQCLTYCAIFKKDERTDKDELVRLWLAQGFLGSGGYKDLEKIGRDYFDDLAMRSFFQDFKKGADGNITSSNMHDLVHDFVLFLTKTECYFLEVGKELDSNKVRHLATKTMESSSIYKARNLRTLMINNLLSHEQLIKIFNQLKCLRTLDLSKSRIDVLPSKVERLLHIRYIDLSDTFLSELPETICNLHNLQILKLNNCGLINKLPDRIGKLHDLRHLELRSTSSLSYLPQGIGRLSLLRTLTKFVVSDTSNVCNISELKILNFLQGSLILNGLERVVDANEAAQAELKKKKLVVLSLNFEKPKDGDCNNMAVVLQNLQPHENVEELYIIGFRGSRFPSWISNSSLSANLLRLRLDKCKNIIELPALGTLGSLEVLEIIQMRDVRYIGSKFYGFSVAFPKLKELFICNMREWVEWELPVSTDIIIMSCLQKLSLYRCPVLRALPGLGKLKSLESLVIHELSQLKHIGKEFYGNLSSSGAMAVAFPNLKKLEVWNMKEWVEWELPIAADNKIMPCLSVLSLRKCPMLSALPGHGALDSLELVYISALPSIRWVGLEFLGISDEEYGLTQVNGSEEEGSSSFRKPVILFPRLTKLEISFMEEWEDWILPFQKDRQVMPCLHTLILESCQKLRALLDLAVFLSLENLCLGGFNGVEWKEREDIKLPCLCDLTLRKCPSLHAIPRYFCKELKGMQPCLPPLLESLGLRKAGVFSESLPVIVRESSHNNYPNLKYFSIYSSKHPSLPKGFKQLTAIQRLEFIICESLDFNLNELEHLTKLQELSISECPILAKRFKEAEDWMSILSHVPIITIDRKNIRDSN
ncbi:hypothetical protein AQUCO_08300037v1 [Aquilegia coerulea]|uniref:Uncharacterized protein n=1 Tax=Aquilegia coerulea TaxID=218851 RepID=A0A2G5C8E9_AQUCA|nr:hypothetical protein AQUCO_08300037v1 [Aquilegia coerulea]